MPAVYTLLIYNPNNHVKLQETVRQSFMARRNIYATILACSEQYNLDFCCFRMMTALPKFLSQNVLFSHVSGFGH
jgi:hypothetical protein